MKEHSEKALLAQVEKEFNGLLSLVDNYSCSSIRLDEAEKGLLSSLLSLGLGLLQLFLLKRNAQICSKVLLNKGYVSKGSSPRTYQSIFGKVNLERLRFHHPTHGSYYPLDYSISLPEGGWSYLLSDWILSSATTLGYRESVRLVNEILNQKLAYRSVKSHLAKWSDTVSKYYETKEVISMDTTPNPLSISAPSPITESLAVALTIEQEKQVSVVPEEEVFLVSGWDGKGIPVLESEEQKTVELGVGLENELPSTNSHLGIRRPKHLGKGEKKGKKRMATVSVQGTFIPNQRTSSSILEGLFYERSGYEISEEEKKTHTLSFEKLHRRGFFMNQNGAIAYGVDRLKQMSMSAGKKPPIVVITDCGVGLESGIRTCFEQQQMAEQLRYIIADFVHVLEYIWKASNSIHLNSSKLRKPWVKSICEDLLASRTDKVIKELIVNRDKTQLSDSAKDTLDKVISYLQNHKHKMDYKVYLEQGLPITTAIIEGTCKYLVKDRMEGGGMRWKYEGAQQMLDLRAVYINDDWSDFVEYRIKQERSRNNMAA